MKNFTVTLSALFLLSSTAYANLFKEIDEAPRKGAVNKVAKRAIVDADKVLMEADAKKAIRIMLEMTEPPKYKGHRVLTSEEDVIKVNKRINGDEDLRYELVKKISELSLRFRLDDEDIVRSLENIMKYDGETRIRRLAMISLLSILEDDKERRAELLEFVSKRDGEVIFVGYSDVHGHIQGSKFKRGLKEETFEPLFDFRERHLVSNKISIKTASRDDKLEVIFLEDEYIGEVSLSASKKKERVDALLNRIDELIHKLQNKPELMGLYTESDLIVLANAEEDSFGRDKLWVKTSNRSAKAFRADEIQNLLERIHSDGVPYYTISRLERLKKSIIAMNSGRERQLSNGVSVVLRNNSIKWAKNLLERNEAEEHFNFNVLYHNAVKKSCADKSKYECRDDLLK